MKERLMELIKNEDKKNPYTDEQLAGMLGARRDEVTILRGELNIPDSRERRKPYLMKAMEEEMVKNPNVSDRELTRLIQKRGFNVSRFIISQLRKELSARPQKQLQETPEKKYKAGSESSTAFERIIGYDGSLKPQIQQAKAAVLYPPHGLHTMILGPTGVGKSILAEAMYQFAIETGKLPPNAPFVVFNCADYAENPQLLLSQLFGHVKGAYTGADSSKDGLVEKANGGILFLDEVHRLPPEGQEILFYLIDKGKFRRLGETEAYRSANVMIIAATTEDIESSLLLTFRRRIPMIIELPPLSARPISERYEIIKDFFRKESDRIGVKIKIKQEALRALLMYDCPGNIGQLRSDIQVACARGFLSYIGNQQDFIEVDLIDLPVHARRGMLKVQNRIPEIETILKGDLMVNPGESGITFLPKEDLYILPEEIYRYIEEKYQELQNQGLSQDVINRVIGGELEVKFQQLVKQFETKQKMLDKKDLEGIVGSHVVNLAEQMMRVAERKLGKVDNHLFYCLAIHLSATLDRIRQGKPIINPQLEKVKNEYTLEYRLAKEMLNVVELATGYKIPEDEVAFVAMYLRTATRPIDLKTGRVGVVVLTHGHVAKGMVEVANRLLGVDHAVGIEMGLDEKPESALNKTMEVVKNIDEGKGVLLLVDMGSLMTFGEIITQKTGIPTRTVWRVDTVMVLEAVRRAILPDTNLDDIVENIQKDELEIGRFAFNEIRQDNDKEWVILTVCITGKGAAIKLKELIKEVAPDIFDKAEIIPIGAMMDEDIKLQVKKIKMEKKVAAIVGTVNPEDEDIPFISLEELVSGEAFNTIRQIMGVTEKVKTFDNKLSGILPFTDLFHEDLIVINGDFQMKNDVLDQLGNLLIKNNFVNERYLLDVYRRELMGPTLLKNKVAIPHGTPENVLKSAIALAILKNPIKWTHEDEAEIVVMLALKENSVEIFRRLYKVLQDVNFIDKVKSLKDVGIVKKVLLEYILSFNRN
ncbi:sigma 54-interacting transcriptional regulator [Thermosediminibacter oceani]|uniref:PTS system transcriptional activator n=1 Tax=Thermosediminibacter oceani (strain ATCC BAA-1034 / DSM 16646 / JW/IW-1228P) TaxID=555079 RepID=D9RXX5_THEOJ|nr:sigma 54-interacting transcriptional regulator [Thermosediminibacter oceani]ADL08199.1 PTS system transcriptional activator [Thermosediminibacter oceani DSM 16646]